MCPLLEAPVSNPSCLLSGKSPPTCVHFRQHTTFDRPLLCCGVSSIPCLQLVPAYDCWNEHARQAFQRHVAKCVTFLFLLLRPNLTKCAFPPGGRVSSHLTSQLACPPQQNLVPPHAHLNVCCPRASSYPFITTVVHQLSFYASLRRVYPATICSWQ